MKEERGQIKLRKCDRKHQRICNCGKCKLCSQRSNKNKYYVKNRAILLNKQRIYRLSLKETIDPLDLIDEEKLDALWKRKGGINLERFDDIRGSKEEMGIGKS